MKLLIMAQTPEALVLVVGGVRVVRGGRKRVSQSQPQLEYGRQRDLQPHFLRHQKPGRTLFDRTRICRKG
jgi:hypothetical protein